MRKRLTDFFFLTSSRDNVSLAEEIKKAAGTPTLDGLIVTANGMPINPNISLKEFSSRFDSCFEVSVKKGTNNFDSTTLNRLESDPFNTVTAAEFLAYKTQYDALNPADIPGGK